MQKKFFKIFSVIFAVIFLSFSGAIFINNLNAQWVGPTAPPPNANTLAPIDVSSSNQTKLGGLTLGKDLYLESGLRLLSNGGSNYGYLVNIADTLTYNTLSGGVEVKRFTIGNDGNVAIGDVIPTAKLHVAGDIKASGKIYSGGFEVLTSGSITIPPNSISSLEVIDGSLLSVDVDTSSIQARVSASCAVNSSIRAIAQDGTVTCELDDTGASYVAGSGIIISGNTISATPFTETDPSVPANIKDGISWSEISGIPSGFADGVDDVGGAALGPDSVGTAEIKNGSILSVDVSTADIQVRIGGTCPSGQAIRTIAEDGTVTCEPVGGIETDPTVPANIKDGISWSEISGIPSGFADGVDDTSSGGGGGIQFTYVQYINPPNTKNTGFFSCGPGDFVTGVECIGSDLVSGDIGCVCRDIDPSGNGCSGEFNGESYLICLRP